MLNSVDLIYLRKAVLESVAARSPTDRTANHIVETERIINYLLTGDDPSLPPRKS